MHISYKPLWHTLVERMERNICIYVVITLLILFSLPGCGSKIAGEQGLIDKAREEINVADADTIDIGIAGMSEADDNVLFWFITGNEYQKHSYFPIAFQRVGEEQ